MALAMNKAMPTCLLALLLVMSTALLPCHATGRDIAGTGQWAKYCVAFPSCKQHPEWAINNCKTTCEFFGYVPSKSYCQPDYDGICCCLK